MNYSNMKESPTSFQLNQDEPVRSAMASRPSNTRTRKRIEEARANRIERDKKLAGFAAGVTQPGFRSGEPSERKRKNKLERRLTTGIAALGAAALAAGVLHFGAKGAGEGEPVNPQQNAIEKAAAEHKLDAQATEADQQAAAAQAQAETTQSDIERYQAEQTELHRPPAK